MRPTAALLLLALAAVTAGCAAPGTVTMDRVDDDRLAERAHRSLAAIEDDHDEDRFAALVREAIANGSSVTGERRDPPLDTTYPLKTRSGYYVVDRARRWNGSATIVDVQIDYNGTAPRDERIAWEELPPGDREAVTRAVEEQRSPHVTLEPGTDTAVEVSYTDVERNASVLLHGEPRAVVHDDTVYPVVLDPGHRADVVRYRYTARRVADDDADFARWLKRERMFLLDDLTDDERRIVEAAIDDGYQAGDTDDTAFQSLVDRFRRHEPVEIREGNGAQYVVRYRDRTYWVRMRFEGYV